MTWARRARNWLKLHLLWCWCQVVGHKEGGLELASREGGSAGVIEMCARCTAPMRWRAYGGQFPQPRERVTHIRSKDAVKPVVRRP